MTSSVADLTQLLEFQADRFGQAPLFSFVDEEVTWSFEDLLIRAGRTAKQFRDAGVAFDDKVGILERGRARFIESFFGLGRLGAVPVPLPTSGRAGTEGWTNALRRRSQTFACSAIACDADVAPMVLSAGLTPVVVDGSLGSVDPDVQTNHVAIVQPSSGTTGDQKGIVLSHRAVLANVRAMVLVSGVSEQDVGISWLPLYHDMGLIGSVLGPLAGGMHFHQWATDSFMHNPTRWLTLIEGTGVTHTITSPTALEILRRRWLRKDDPGVDLRRLRGMTVGGEYISPTMVDSFLRTFVPHGLDPGAFLPVYGLAEATLAVSMSPVGRPPRFLSVDDRTLVSCGPPIPEVRVEVSDTGELWVQSPSLMDGYLGTDGRVAAGIDDGWLHTGDIGYLDHDEVVIAGRVKDMINRNGLRIPAVEFEAVVRGDAVAGDRVAAFGVDGDAGEIVVVLVESRLRGLAAQELAMSLRRRLADAGLPADLVEIVPIRSLPRTTSGKVRRTAARDAYLSTRQA